MNDRFEEALARTVMPQPDPAWKSEILSLAAAPKRRRRLPILKLSLAACWLVIGVLQLSMPEPDGEAIADPGQGTPPAGRLSSLYLLAAYTTDIDPND